MIITRCGPGQDLPGGRALRDAAANEARMENTMMPATIASERVVGISLWNHFGSV
jgi:hypothetical protein